MFLFLAVFIVKAQEEVLNEDCSINWEVFNKQWKKYSDLDERLSFEEFLLKSRSWETQQFYNTQQKIVDLELQIFLLKRDMEIDRLMRLELREHKQRLVRNIKVNLLKSFWRLAYITYDTIKGAKGVGQSYEKLFTSSQSISKLGATLKVLQGLSPKDSKTVTNTNKIVEALKSVGLSGALEALESMGDPKDIAKTVFDKTTKQILPSADLTPEEIEILRFEHLENRTISEVLEKSYKVNSERLKKVKELEAQVQELEHKKAQWEQEEKNRMADKLVNNCKKKKKKEVVEKPEEEPFRELGVVTEITVNDCPLPSCGYRIRLVEGGGTGICLFSEIINEFFPGTDTGLPPDFQDCEVFILGCSYCNPDLEGSAVSGDSVIAILQRFNSIEVARKSFQVWKTSCSKEFSKMLGKLGEKPQISEDTENTFVRGFIDSKYIFRQIIGLTLYKNYVFFIFPRIMADSATAKCIFNEIEEGFKVLVDKE